MLGRIAHFTADAVLLSAVLAGIKRNSGLEPATEKIENEEIRKYVNKYLDIGEWVIDSSVVFMNNSSYFERKK
ncbi:unnamed protein product [Mucor circinelloides]|uniref:DUF1748-domain-containing protein n=1 Tax=Mucor circinelloides f. circinelloides (strain 1006PhL) TaxID=1220926 RepID=S2JKW3_MUCC1|nr:hypothetical protein HMPREF1544_02220 [Mucor circinelloides 1006PhL]KAG1078376.1 hypothetical protein G6F42_024295 [Rhizopus arrhizus]